MKRETKLIHGGAKPEKLTGAVIAPMFLTSTYKQEFPGKFARYDYSRGSNPNFDDLERAIALSENAKAAVIFPSGSAALSAVVFTLLRSGDRVLLGDDVYGGTFRLFSKILLSFNIGFDQVDYSRPDLVAEAVKKEKYKMAILESPSNPLLKITDIRKISRILQGGKIMLLVDNTFASPVFQNPLLLGADFVLHSTTKYISGHSDCLGGAVAGSHSLLFGKDKGSKMNRLEYIRNAMGFNPSPHDAWLTLRGFKTLAVRMKKHEENAMGIARFLLKRKEAKTVYYPFLQSHPGFVVAKSQMKGGGGIVSCEFKLKFNEVRKLISGFRYFILAESLGGIESLVDHPASMTHGSIPLKVRRKNGISDSLVRFSVGIEDVSDLISDLRQGLDKFA